MSRREALGIVVLLMCWPITGIAGQGFEEDETATFFELKIRPVLAGTCFPCHGGEKTSSGLRVDARAALLEGGHGGPALVPGVPEESLLIEAVRYGDAFLRMPPSAPLAPEVVADFETWVRAGAPWPETGSPASSDFAGRRHWAFEPVPRVEPPDDPDGWSDHPIDRFLAERWRAEGLRPVGLADKRTLIRRVFFNLIGLPPSPEEVEAFLADEAPDAFERLVDRLLASPHYGERWGRFWMDVARFADTAGDNADYPIPEVHQYRDYIIDAFNADKPYDQFVREQVAGDILAGQGPSEDYAERVVATGFLALSRRYATAPYELWHLTLENTIDALGQAFLGLTLRCARCHDHKFDPTTTEDYYALYGIFASTTFPYAGSEEFQSMNRPRENFVPLLPPSEAASRRDEYERRIEHLESEIERLEANDPTTWTQETAQSLDALRGELRVLRRLGSPPNLPVAYAVSEGTPQHVAVQQGGDPGKPGPVVRRGVPKFLAGDAPPEFPEEASGRLELANWLTRPDHPLTARVMVNRIWQGHFGQGLVRTPSNFGLQGDEPSHPELLDFLAARFVASGWSIKTMHRFILSSQAYRLSSAFDADNAAVDPANTRLWRFDRRRLDAEALRDAMLHVSGRLDLDRPGPHPFPPIEQWHWTQHNAFKEVYPSNHRSVYLMTQRLQRHPFLALFDGPDTNHSTEQRTSSTVPLQALFLMNNPFVHECGSALADRLISATDDPRHRMALAHELAWCRPATADEIQNGLDYIERFSQESRNAGAPADAIEREAWSSFARILLSANEFLYID